MSTEDINIRLTAQDSGATAALTRLRDQVLNNEKGLKAMGQQGKLTGKSLKDMAGMLGPELGVIGDRFDQITGALGDVQGAGILAKGALVGLVAVGGFEVGKMLGEWATGAGEAAEELKKFQEQLRETDKQALSFLQRQGQAELGEIAGLPSEEAAKRQFDAVKRMQSELASLEERRAAKAAEIESRDWGMFQTGDYAADTERMKIELQMMEDRKKVVMENWAAMQKLDVAAIARKESEQAAVEALRQSAQAEAEQARMREQAAAQAERLQQTQEDYLFNLEAELVKLREGEEAYTRLTLSKQGFEQATIDAALAMRAEIDAIKEAEAAKLRQEREAASRQGADQQRREFQAPGQVQGTQARFITRGTGSAVQDRILAAAQKQVEKQSEVVAAVKQMVDHFRRIGVV
jgi:hypothetical protein